MKKSVIGYLVFTAAALLVGVYLVAAYSSPKVSIESTYEPPYDYRFESGDYTLYGVLVEPQNAPFNNQYKFSLFCKNKKIGSVPAFESDMNELYNYDIWWKKRLVDCDIDGTSAVIKVGIFRLQLDFAKGNLNYTREYSKEMLGNLLTSNHNGEKQIFEINFGNLSDELNTNDIVLFDNKTLQIQYLTYGNFMERISFDKQDNILAYSDDGMICFDGNTALQKKLPFNFQYQHGDYNFVDFLYDNTNGTYILAWAEKFEMLEMIPEEITYKEEIPNINVSIFSANGTLIFNYDTKLMVPQYKRFDECWPILSLDNVNGLQLAGYYTDGRRRTWLSMPESDYQKILQTNIRR